MRINYSPTRYAEWQPQTRTINLWERVPGYAFHLEVDVISFGYDKPDNTTTAIDALDALIRRLIDDGMMRHPAGRDRCPCPTCQSGVGPCSDISKMTGRIL